MAKCNAFRSVPGLLPQAATKALKQSRADEVLADNN